MITLPWSGRACRVVKQTGLDRIFLETDAPYFLPSGATRNPWNCSFPGHVIHVASRVADIKQISVEDVLQQNLQNGREIYSKFFERKYVEEEKMESKS